MEKTRDFSEDAKAKLLGYIEEESESYVPGDWPILDGLIDWAFLSSVKKEWESMEKYYRRIVDKNNSTKREVEKIWDDIRALDVRYENRFKNLQELADAYLKKINRIADIIKEGDITSNTALVMPVDRFNSLFLEANKEIRDAEYELALGKLIQKYANGNIVFYWDELTLLMSKDAEKVTQAEYLALIAMFNATGENMEQKARFIEASYINPQAYPVQGSSLIDCNWKHSLSPVFISMAGRYYAHTEYILATFGYTNSEMAFKSRENKLLAFNQGLLKGVCQNASELFTYGTYFNGWELFENREEIKVSFENQCDDMERYTYRFSFNAANELLVYSIPGEKPTDVSFKVYEYHSNLKSLLDNHTISFVETLKRDKNQELFEYGVETLVGEVFSAGKDSAMEELEAIVKGLKGTGKAVGSTFLKAYDWVELGTTIVIDVNELSQEVDEHNRNMNQIITNLETGNWAAALQMGSQITVNHDNTNALNHHSFNQKNLDFALYIYSKLKDPYSKLNSDDIIDAMQEMNIKEKNPEMYQQLKKYVDWYTGKTPEFVLEVLERLDRAMQNTEYADISINDLTIDQLKDLINRYPEVLDYE